MWHENLYNILNIINNIILIAIGIPFSLQLINMLFFWVKKKTFKKSDKKGRVAFIISAHNEEDVIYDTVNLLLTKQNYPRELMDVYVVCHNCQDNTEAEVIRAGAKPIVYNDPDPKKHMVAYALNYGIDYIMKLDINYDFLIRLDADNHINDDFTSLMNDAFQSGVEYARPYESALNMTQNNYTKACGLYYVFDSRFSSRVRERLHIGAHVNGPGMMISMETLRKRGGYHCTSISEDAELTVDLMNEGVFAHFVEDAVVYEDLPATLSDTNKRNRRIGSGSIRLIFGKIGALFFKFFYKFKVSYMEYFLTYFFNIICVILCTWLPAFYIYDLIYLGMAGNGMIEVTLNNSAYYLDVFYNTLILIAICLTVLFIFCGWLQAFILIMLDYKKMGAKRRRDLVSGMLLFPFFSVVYIVTLTFGVFSKPTWGKVTRNSQFYKQTNAE